MQTDTSAFDFSSMEGNNKVLRVENVKNIKRDSIVAYGVNDSIDL